MFDYKQISESLLKLNTFVTRNSKLIKFNNDDVIMVYNDRYSSELDDFDFPFLCRYSEFYLRPASNSTIIRIANLVIPFNLTIGLVNILDVDLVPSTNNTITPQSSSNDLYKRVEQGLEQRLNEYMQANNLQEKRVIKYYRVLPNDLDNITLIVNVLERSLVLAHQLAKPDEKQMYAKRAEQLLNENKSSIAPITNITPTNFSNLIKNSHSILSDLLRKDYYHFGTPEQVSIIFTLIGNLDNINQQLYNLINVIKDGSGSEQNILEMLNQFDTNITNILRLFTYLPDNNTQILRNIIDDVLTNLNYLLGLIDKIITTDTARSMIINQIESIIYSIQQKTSFV
ncbi:MAG: hypothetical protein ACK4IX_11950, partial [Candidatus Sericytochromatia bacterium]